VEELTTSIDRIKGYAEEIGRNPAEIGVAYNATWNNDREATILADGTRRSFTGVPEQVAADIKSFEAAGLKDRPLKKLWRAWSGLLPT
jgi:alkanesulfonate monooxygenase SsuD/methylene tetrahydromethanopterin reductase-like flavin-dependent oxidoreductase (luciferase family)